MERSILKHFSPIYIHQEEEPVVSEINENTSDIAKNIEQIDNNLITSGIKLKNLIEKTKLRLTIIKEHLSTERERQEDMNILCNRYTDFASVLTLIKEDFSGDLTIDNNILSAKLKTSQKINCSVSDINGNGYEGNAYVFSDGTFSNEIIDSSNRKSIVDNNIATYYEYSRITVDNDREGVPIAFNKDSTEAECSIELKAEKPINKLLITSDRDDIVLSKVFISQDGLVYKLDKEYNTSINERYERYNNQEYIYGSGIIAVESCQYIKLFFKSKGYTNDTIAFIDTFYNSAGESSNVIKKIEKVEGAKRHAIKINDISLYKNKYDKGLVLSKELITNPINTMALYCNEYINNDYNIDNNISYYLIVNGVEYQIQPINSHRNGKKIVRMSAQSYKSDHIIYLNENIKSAKLKIIINSANQDITPYISDIKILIGGNTLE